MSSCQPVGAAPDGPTSQSGRSAEPLTIPVEREPWLLLLPADEPDISDDSFAPDDYVSDWGFGEDASRAPGDGDEPHSQRGQGTVKEWFPDVWNFVRNFDPAGAG